MERDLFTIAEVAQYYGVCDETVRRWIRRKALDYVLVGPARLRRIPREAVERFPVRPVDSSVGVVSSSPK